MISINLYLIKKIQLLQVFNLVISWHLVFYYTMILNLIETLRGQVYADCIKNNSIVCLLKYIYWIINKTFDAIWKKQKRWNYPWKHIYDIFPIFMREFYELHCTAYEINPWQISYVKKIYSIFCNKFITFSQLSWRKRQHVNMSSFTLRYHSFIHM